MIAKMMALSKAIDITIDCCFIKVVFEINNKKVTKRIIEEEDYHIVCGMFGNNICKKLKQFGKSWVCLSEKETNDVTRMLAKCQSAWFRSEIKIGHNQLIQNPKPMVLISDTLVQEWTCNVIT